MAKTQTSVWMSAAALAAPFLLYVVACALPAAAFSVFSNDSECDGLGLLVFGWIGGPQAWLPWSSNFLWLVGMVLLAIGRPGWGLVFGTVGLVFAGRVLLPHTGAVLLQAKYWWLGSHAVLVIGCAAACVRSWGGPRSEIPKAEPGAAPDPAA